MQCCSSSSAYHKGPSSICSQPSCRTSSGRRHRNTGPTYSISCKIKKQVSLLVTKKSLKIKVYPKKIVYPNIWNHLSACSARLASEYVIHEPSYARRIMSPILYEVSTVRVGSSAETNLQMQKNILISQVQD